jgi:hypothetical protein
MPWSLSVYQWTKSDNNNNNSSQSSDDGIIQGVLKMAHNIFVTRIYVEQQTKNSNVNLFLDE